MVRRPSRLLRITKRAGVAVCILIAIVWLASGWWHGVYFYPPGTVIGVDAGGWFYVDDYANFSTLHNYYAGAIVGTDSGRNRAKLALGSHNSYWYWAAPWPFDENDNWMWLPCWTSFLFVAFPTAVLFWLGRRRIPLGHCRKCGYDLRGNESGVCPECGAAVKGNSDAHT